MDMGYPCLSAASGVLRFGVLRFGVLRFGVLLFGVLRFASHQDPANASDAFIRRCRDQSQNFIA